MYLDIFSTFAEKNERLPIQYSSEKGTVWQPLIEGIFSCYAIKLQAGCVRLIQWRNFKPTLHYYIFVWKCMLFGAFSSSRLKTPENVDENRDFRKRFQKWIFLKNASFWCGKVKTEAFGNGDEKINRCDCSHGGEIPGPPCFIVFGRFSVKKKTLRKRWCGQKYFASFSPVWRLLKT